MRLEKLQAILADAEAGKPDVEALIEVAHTALRWQEALWRSNERDRERQVQLAAEDAARQARYEQKLEQAITALAEIPREQWFVRMVDGWQVLQCPSCDGLILHPNTYAGLRDHVLECDVLCPYRN